MVKTSSTPSHNARRIKYSINILIACLVAITIVLIINIIAYRQSYRFDFSSTRAHTLSQQSEKAIDRLKKPFQITALIHQPKINTPEFDKTTKLIDLLDLYAQRSEHITSNHIYLSDSIQRDAYLDHISKKFRKQGHIDRCFKIIEQGYDKLKSAEQPIKHVVDLIDTLLKDNAIDGRAIAHRKLRQTLRQARIAFTDMSKRQHVILAAIKKELSSATPHLVLCQSHLLNLLLGHQQDVHRVAFAYRPQLEHLLLKTKPLLNSSRTPTDIIEPLARLNAGVTALLDTLSTLDTALQSMPKTTHYDQYLADIQTGQSVIIEQGEHVESIALDRLFVKRQDYNDQAVASQDVNFLGEELITGNLIKMSQKYHPRIVFVSTTGKHPLDRFSQDRAARPRARESYTYLARRLNNLHFETTVWFPLDRSASGGHTRFRPAPPAKPHQKTIWILLPLAQRYHQSQFDLAAIGKTVAYLDDRTGRGDAAMLMLHVRPGNSFGHPVSDWLKRYGIKLHSDQQIFRIDPQASRANRANPFYVSNHWLKTHIIAKTLHGTLGLLPNCFPLSLPDDNPAVKALVRLDEGRLWAERSTNEIKDDPDEVKDSFDVACTVESENRRLVITSSFGWASDLIAGNTDPRTSLEGAGYDEKLDRAYPANSSLFINSIYWLADFDQLIGANPSSHAVRRIDQIDEIDRSRLRLFFVISLPAITLLAGVFVYWRRRRH